MTQDSKWVRFLKEPRTVFTLMVVIFSFVAIWPVPTPSASGTMELKTNILEGLDLKGGVRAIILPDLPGELVADETISVLDSRLSAFGLQETKIRKILIEDTYYIEIELAGSTEEQLKNLLENQGKFEAYIPRKAAIEDGSGTIKVDGNPHKISVVDEDTVNIDGVEKNLNDTVAIEGVDFTVKNITEDSVVLSGLIYRGKDILQVFKDAQHSGVTQVGSGSFRFQFEILTTADSAQRFAKVTKDSLVLADSVESAYLDTKIELYLDDALTDSLNIASSLRGQPLTTPQITGGAATKKDAIDQMRLLQSILESGALPSKITIVQMNEVSPTLGKEFLSSAFVAIFLAIVAVAAVVFARYRDPKLVLPMIATSTSEIIIILGFAALVRWTIDLPSIAGIVAAIGTGIDNQIVIADESDRKKEELGLAKKFERAFFIIMASAATTVAAMIPLLSVGAGGVKGFAFTTIVGVLSGVLITRPAFVKVVEYLRK